MVQAIRRANHHFFGFPDEIQKIAMEVLDDHAEIVEGAQWPTRGSQHFCSTGKAGNRRLIALVYPEHRQSGHHAHPKRQQRISRLLSYTKRISDHLIQ
jgi:hypothetical protein